MAGILQQPQQPQPSIWAQMAYTPPRGPCSLKTSLLTTCPCYRFMIHPLRASTSFDCDGCGHHASFHRMESREEEEVVRRWRGVGVAEREDEVEGREKGKERQRQRQRQSEGGMVVIEGDGGTDEETMMMERFVVGPKKRVQKGRKRRMIGGVERDVVEVLEGDEEEEIPVAAGRKRKGRE